VRVCCKADDVANQFDPVDIAFRFVLQYFILISMQKTPTDTCYKHWIDCKYVAQKLFATLTTLEQKGMEEISKKHLEVEWLQSAMEAYRRFATELCDNGTASDIATSAERLHLRACDLKKHDVIRQTKLPFSVTCIVFQQSTFGSKAPLNIVGCVDERSSFKGSINTHLCGPACS